jgi:hypothetical protein
MNELHSDVYPRESSPWSPCPEEVVEITLLLPGRQAAALEAAARQRNTTTGQLLRCLVHEFVRAERRR